MRRLQAWLRNFLNLKGKGLEAEKPEQKAPESSKDHDYVAAVEKQSEEIRRIGSNLQSLEDKITTTSQTNEDSQKGRHAEQMGVERRFLRWQQVSVFVAGVLSFLTLAVLTLTIYFAERAAVTFGAPDGKLMKMVCHGEGGSLFTYFQNSGKTPAVNVLVEIWPLHDDNQPANIPAYHGVKATQETIPPGFPYPETWNGLNCSEINAIQSEKLHAIILGRFSYNDGFYRNHCQGFTAWYYGDPIKDFEIFPIQLTLCDGWERQVYWRHITGTTKGTADMIEQVFPTRTKLVNGKPVPLKDVLVYFNGYQNATSVPQTMPFPAPFTSPPAISTPLPNVRLDAVSSWG
jgi:hypothetical protein